jgi:CRISPR-associated protein Csx3
MSRIERQVPSSAAYGLVELTNPSGLRLQLLPHGELFAIRHGATLINQVLPTPAERGLRRLVLRDRTEGVGTVVDLTGPAVSFAPLAPRQAGWTGRSGGWAHTVRLFLHPELPLWLWQVELRNEADCARSLDLLYGQDLGLADEAGVRGNEAFTSQYIDHTPVAHDAWGVVLLARQNQPQAGNAHPWLAQGCLTGSDSFATDGFQFFGRDHRRTAQPAAYRCERLPGERLQYEFAYAALQTPVICIPAGGRWETAFFACYQPDHAAASGPADLAEVTALVAAARSRERAPFPAVVPPPAAASVFQAPVLVATPLAEDDWGAYFPGAHRHIERDAAGQRLSFFYDESWHVVAQAKEALVERPHGHLLRSGTELWLSGHALGSTLYAAGIFNAQVYLGNTNLARCLSVVRNALEVMASSGQRVFVRRAGAAAGAGGPDAIGPDWRRLGVPSAFAIGLTVARWLYRLGGTEIEAVTQMDAEQPHVTLSLRVRSGAPCEFLVTHLLVLGDREMDQGFVMTVAPAAGRFEFAPDPQTLLGSKCPSLRFTLAAAEPADVAACGGDEALYADGRSRQAPYAVLQSRAVTQFAVTLAGASVAAEEAGTTAPLLEGLPRLLHTAASHVAEALPWMAHNAAMHFTAPRGLEQYGGAAWGVRDVCQGPVEWLLATRQFAPVRRLLRQVFEQQYECNGCWPQWFMFEPFRFIQSVHAHGDVPFWPVKALCDYVEASGDLAVLDEPAGYTDEQNFTTITTRESLLQHALRVVTVYQERRIPGTALVNYGEGDWDDTLQPADPALRANMVSAWTVALAYHVFRQLHEVCQRAGRAGEAARLDATLAEMRRDFQRWLLPDGVLAGFLVFDAATPRPLLHPRDAATGIGYRLLPMTRAMLAELLTPAQAAQHLALIREHLLFPDGVRLMSAPVPYRGGVERWFKRAETAANFGREIGLMYTHAHLRYVEALAKCGRGAEAWEMLGRVTPVQLAARVATAVPRQGNSFFSSSDAAFADRYEAAARFEELRQGRVAVKGGWRIYSSGPGLYLNRVVRHLLGLRDSFGDLVVDPVLPPALDGLVVEWPRDGARVEWRFTVGAQGFGPVRIRLNGRDLPLERREPNPYRSGGVRLDAAAFRQRLQDGQNVVEIEVG